MLTLQDARFRYEPYPIGVASGVFDPETYEILVSTFPDEGTFKHLGGAYNKWSLSERNHPEAYVAFLRQSPPWSAFYRYVKGLAVLNALAPCLKRAGLPMPSGKLTARFEFSSLPSEGGGIEPHTDIPSKVLTLILPMVRPGEWDETWGGSTDVLRPLDPWRLYRDYQEPRKSFDLVMQYPYAPNQCVIFIKTFNSWHAVGPIDGPPGRWRRTITLNIEQGT